MKRRWLAVVALGPLVVCPAASADDDDGSVHGGTGDSSIWAGSLESNQDSHGSKPGPVDHLDNVPTGPQIVLGEQACQGAEQLIENQVASGVTFCAGAPPESKPQPALTLGLIRSAFAELRLPAGTLVIQPPDGLTLVNFDTNFYTSSTAPITRTVTLLGRRVTLEATPSRYRWDFGDGGTTTTTKPGAPYPRLDITHRYLRKGTFRPRLDTTYSGRYRVGGGPWRAIPGTVTITGQAQALRTIEAQPKLVSY